MFSAGEASGDKYAANIFIELKKQLPKIIGFGMGGSKMQHSGIEINLNSSGFGVIGLWEALKRYWEIHRGLKFMQSLVALKTPNLLVCVDYKEFNLRLASYAKKHGVKVLFYISPQVWAWRPDRVKVYAKAIDTMAVIFPFETAYYKAENVPVKYVGHPAIDNVQPMYSKIDAMAKFLLRTDAIIIGIFPGSRINEIKHMLPVMLLAAKELTKSYHNIQFVLPHADSITDEVIQHYLQKSLLKITVIKNYPYDVIQCCDAVMVASGTITLEVALLNIPMVIAYKLSKITYFLGRKLIKTKFIGLPNIIAEKHIVRELIQQNMTAVNLAEEINKILKDKRYNRQMLAELSKVKKKLGSSGGSKNMADLIVQMLQN